MLTVFLLYRDKIPNLKGCVSDCEAPVIETWRMLSISKLPLLPDPL